MKLIMLQVSIIQNSTFLSILYVEELTYNLVEEIASGGGWHSMFMNTGFRGFKQTRFKTPPIGFVDTGSERVPGFNFFDDALGNAFDFLKGLGIANKQSTWFNSTTAIRVVNASYTKLAVAYDFDVKYKYWRRVQNNFQGNEISKMWKVLHNATR